MKSKKTIIHINKNIIQQNNKRGKKLPVCRVELGGKTWYGSKVDILGPSEMIYSPDFKINRPRQIYNGSTKRNLK